MSMEEGQVIIGLDCKSYRNAGTYDIPVWDEIDLFMDVTLKKSKGKSKIANRKSRYNKSKGGLIDASVEGDLTYNSSDSNVVAIMDSFDTGVGVEYAILDGDITVSGSRGLRAVMETFTNDRNEALEEGVKLTITLAPTPAATEPDKYIVG